MQVPSPRVLDAGLHLHVLQRVDRVLLTLAAFGGNLYSDLARCLQLPVGRVKEKKNIAGCEAHKQPSLQTRQIPSDVLISVHGSGKPRHYSRTCCRRRVLLRDCSSIKNPNFSKYPAHA